MDIAKPIIVLTIILAGAAGYLGYQDYTLRQNNAALEGKIAQMVAEAAGAAAAAEKAAIDIKNLNTDVATLNEILEETKSELATTTAQLADATAARIDFETQYNREKNKVTTFEKLKQIDPELLKKYSKVYFLNENYVPKSLAPVDKIYNYNQNETYQISADVWPFLKILLATARADNIDLEVISAYRSFSEQNDLKSSYKMTYGAGANKFSADQGYSEHQLGTTVDFTTREIGADFEGFEKTATYKWLRENAYQYGFILSYPQNNSYYQFEPWHWRFVGRALAQKLHDEGKNFYDLDQREIDDYRISFLD